jgi:hypothetical protein
MKTKILAGLLLAGSAAFAAPRVAFGIGIGVPAPIVMAAPPCPGPGYVFIDGYWRPGPGYWHEGYRRGPVVRYEARHDHFRR